MPQANRSIGETIRLHFVWKIPNGHFVRALFDANILDIDLELDRYLVKLTKLVAKREETETGAGLSEENHTADYWQLVYNLTGRMAHIAFEADDGRPLFLRLPTLTLDHKFFTRYESADRVEEDEY